MMTLSMSFSFTSLPVSPNLQLQPHSHQRFFTKCNNLSAITTSFAAVKCNSVADDSSERGGGGGGGGSLNLKDLTSGMVDERVKQIMNNEEKRVLLDKLEKATQRVEMAMKQLSIIQQQQPEAKLVGDHMNHQLHSKASESKIADCQKEVSEAKAMMEEAERSVIMNDIRNRDYSVTKMMKDQGVMDKYGDNKLETVKAASISAIVGTLAALPLSLTRINSYSDLILPLTITSFSCALFGATFRYAIRRDLDNVHLKSGTCAAFGFVKGLGELGAGPPLEMEMGSLVEHAVAGAFDVSENLVTFFFAAVALDLCIKFNFLTPIPSDY